MTERRKVWRRWALGGVLLAAGGVVFGLRLRGPMVETVGVVRKDLVRTVVTSGRVMAPAEVKVGSLVSATIVSVLVREGQTVNRGDLLVVLDDSSAKAQERQALAALAEARAGRQSVRALDVPAARQQLEQAKARLSLEASENERTQMLLSKNVLPPSDAEVAATNLRLAESQVRAAELQLKAVSAGGSAAERAAAATAAAEAQLERARVELSHTRIEAPATGVVLERFVEPGDLVNPGALLFTLATQGETRIVIEPDERSLSLIALGQKARVSSEAYPDDSFDATLGYIAPSVNPRRGTIEVRLDVPSPPSYLRPDMTVSTEVLVGEEKQAIVVPAYAVQARVSEPWVFVVEGKRLAKRAVKVGAGDKENVQITSGLEPGERVVTRVTPELESGKRVRFAGASSP